MKSVLLLVVTVWLNVQYGGCALLSSCSHPPSKWCATMDSAIQCGVLKHCLQSNFTKSHRQTADPVEVGLYYESLCPGCRMFLTEMLYPTWLLLGDIMTVKLVPYGNALETTVGQKYNFQCQHGPPECLGNMIETCLLNMTQGAFNTIFCMESSPDVVNDAEKCVELHNPELTWKSVMDCVQGDLGNQLMHQNAEATKNLKPAHEYVPWLTINGEHTDDLQDKGMSSLVGLVCSMYKGEKPAVCGEGKQRRYRTYCHNE